MSINKKTHKNELLTNIQVRKSGSKWCVESCWLEIVNLVGLGWGILAVGVGYQRTISAGGGSNLGFALLEPRISLRYSRSQLARHDL